MKDILKELYFGKYAPFERSYAPDSEHTKALNKVVALEADMQKALSPEQWTMFRLYADAVAVLASISAEEEFKEGYRLGVRMLLAAFPDEIAAKDVPPISKRK